jgi:hypothetical protein
MKFKIHLEIEVDEAEVLRYMLANLCFDEVDAVRTELEMHLRNSEELTLQDVFIKKCELANM